MGKDKENEFVDVPGGENTGGATVPGVTVPTAAPIAYGDGIESLSYDDWAAINVKDTTKEFQNAQAALDLNYRTDMATYGENAERMYQMGLSGSGVSDIYGANAYSAYLAASNDLKLRQIEEQKNNRQSWEKYRRDQEDKRRLQHATAFSTFAGQYSEDTNGVNNENALRASMAAQGMSQAEVDAVMNDIKGYWAGNASVRDANHKTVIDAGYATAYGLFDGNNAEEVKRALIANGLSEADADEVMQKFYETDENGDPVLDENGNPKLKDTSALPAVKAEKDAAKQNAFAYMLEQYNAGVTDTAKLAKQAAALFDLDETAMSEVNDKFAPFAKTEEEITKDNAQYLSQGVNEAKALFTDKDGAYNYSGSATDKAAIKQALRGTELEEYADQIIAQLDEDLKALKDAAVKDIVTTIEGGDGAIGANDDVIDQVITEYGEGSAEAQKALAANSKKELDSYTSMLSSVDALGSADTAKGLGIDADEWAAMDDDDREKKVMDTAAERVKEGKMTQRDFHLLIGNSWLGPELNLIIEEDTKKARAVGLKESGRVVAQLLAWKEMGALSESAYNDLLDTTIRKMGFTINGNKISWGSNGEDATFSLNAKEQSSGTMNVTDAELIKKLNKAKDTKGYAFVEGKMYYSNNVDPITKEPIWYEVNPYGVKTTGDGVTNTKVEREGIYEILKYMLTPASTKTGTGQTGNYKRNEEYVRRDMEKAGYGSKKE